jgi:hypothetical protein
MFECFLPNAIHLDTISSHHQLETSNSNIKNLIEFEELIKRNIQRSIEFEDINCFMSDDEDLFKSYQSVLTVREPIDNNEE